MTEVEGHLWKSFGPAPLFKAEPNPRVLVHNDKSLFHAKQSLVSQRLLVCQLLQSMLAIIYAIHLTPTYRNIWKYSSCQVEKSLFCRHNSCLSYLKWDVYANRVQGFCQREPCPIHPSWKECCCSQQVASFTASTSGCSFWEPLADSCGVLLCVASLLHPFHNKWTS